jgi:hypothetical protein
MSALTANKSPRPSATHAKTTCRLQLDALEERCLLTANAVLEWHHLAMQAMVNDSYLGVDAKQPGPDRASRALAIVQSAVFDAVNSIDRSFDPYLIQVQGAGGASMEAAVAQAAHDTLVALYPDFSPALDVQLSQDLAAIPSPAARDLGVHVGQTVAAVILAARAHDGSDVMMHYTPQDEIGTWQPDPLHPGQQAVGPMWGDVTPFAVRSADQFHVPPPPRLTSKEYADAFNEVKNYGGDGITTPTLRTPEQTMIGLFWGCDGSPGISTPPRMYNQIAETLAVQEGSSEVQTARLFALVNLALADAGISCWDVKYDYEFWRPVTAIRDAALDGNVRTTADPNWTPLGAPADNGSGTNFTPPFPAYTSGHATFGAALFRTMANFFGTDQANFTVSSDEFNGITLDQNGSVRPVVTRSFTSFSQAAEENGQSRIYLGIHWKFDKEQGIRQGTQIADYVYQHYLRPRQHAQPQGMRVLEQFKAMTSPQTGALFLATTDHPTLRRLVTNLTPTAAFATQANSSRDSAALVSDMIGRLNRGTWGAAARGGNTLAVDLNPAAGGEFQVLHKK